MIVVIPRCDEIATEESEPRVAAIRAAIAQIVRQCVVVGLFEGKHLSVDGSFVEANTSK